MKQTTLTANGKVVSIRAVTVGINFGCVGQVVARNGKVIAETDTKPLGYGSAAAAAAVQLASKIGETQ